MSAPLDRFRVDGKVAVVTGATRGLGRAIAQGLSAAGATVVVSSRKQDSCDQVADDIAAATGARTVGLACHVGRWDEVPGFVDRVYAEVGRVDVLVNNAGISPTPVTLVDLELPLLDKLLEVNFKGPLRLASLLAPRMRDDGGGSIINISSLAAYRGSPNNAPYSTSKAALNNLTQVMASEWAAWGIRVNAIAPGPFLTELLAGGDAMNPGMIARTAESTLQKRVADPDEIVGAVIYLASDASSYVTGEDHRVGGGLML